MRNIAKTRTPTNNARRGLAVVETGLVIGARAYVFKSPTIYGVSSGLLNKLSVRISKPIRTLCRLVTLRSSVRATRTRTMSTLPTWRPFRRFCSALQLEGNERLAFAVQGIYFSEMAEHA
ncbi:hypothetical protein BDW75DRAFT_95629 [Aspergillus navahoensis]